MAEELQEGGLIVPIEKGKSLFKDKVFHDAKSKAEPWLNIPYKPNSKNQRIEMDSVVFHNDRFELIVDARGYQPEDLKCVINPNTIEVWATRKDATGVNQKSMSTARHYQLNQIVRPEQAICCLSNEGILLIAVPWQK